MTVSSRYRPSSTSRRPPGLKEDRLAGHASLSCGRSRPCQRLRSRIVPTSLFPGGALAPANPPELRLQEADELVIREQLQPADQVDGPVLVEDSLVRLPLLEPVLRDDEKGTVVGRVRSQRPS